MDAGGRPGRGFGGKRGVTEPFGCVNGNLVGLGPLNET